MNSPPRDGVAVKWISFHVFYDIIDYIANDHAITGLEVAVRSANNAKGKVNNGVDSSDSTSSSAKGPHLMLTGRQIASAARAAVAVRIHDGTLLDLLRFRGVEALAVAEFGNEATATLEYGTTKDVGQSSESEITEGEDVSINQSDASNSSRASRVVGAVVFVVVFLAIVGAAQWAWNRRRRQRELQWTNPAIPFQTEDVVYEELQSKQDLSPGGSPSETGGSMIIEVANAMQSDKVSSLGIGTFSEATVTAWQPRGRYSRSPSAQPSTFSSIVHNAFESVSPSDVAIDLESGIDDRHGGELI